jgi:hypothetical protein
MSKYQEGDRVRVGQNYPDEKTFVFTKVSPGDMEIRGRLGTVTRVPEAFGVSPDAYYVVKLDGSADEKTVFLFTADELEPEGAEDEDD